MSLPPPLDNPFPATQWSLVARRAVEDVFTAYRYPLCGFLRGSQMNH